MEDHLGHFRAVYNIGDDRFLYRRRFIAYSGDLAAGAIAQRRPYCRNVPHDDRLLGVVALCAEFLGGPLKAAGIKRLNGSP
jgi:hypothetical protein